MSFSKIVFIAANSGCEGLISRTLFRCGTSCPIALSSFSIWGSISPSSATRQHAESVSLPEKRTSFTSSFNISFTRSRSFLYFFCVSFFSSSSALSRFISPLLTDFNLFPLNSKPVKTKSSISSRNTSTSMSLSLNASRYGDFKTSSRVAPVA
ncbi:MAG: hypothetical protein BWX58_00540 [Deltaproteobacteria bacterium ADurb.Bin026]|nr:MAG: hypothetical protein BWX58_00540 [Deltaproteobacteria bacterium ADurb.Bin026]